MTGLYEGELVIERLRPSPDSIRLDWKGRSLQRHPDELLSPFLYEVLDQALRNTATIEMHFEALEHLNASTVAVLVHFLQRARLHGVAITFHYRRAVRWQRLSFEALQVFEQVDRLVQVLAVPEPEPSVGLSSGAAV